MERPLTPDDQEAVDALFGQGTSALPPVPPDPGPPTLPPPEPPRSSYAPGSRIGSPLGDYIRELQQEFEEQENEGKL